MEGQIGLTNVKAAFDILLEEIRSHIKAADRDAVAAIEAGDYNAASSVVDKAKAMKSFLARMEAMKDEWDAIEGATRVVRVTGRKHGGKRQPMGVSAGDFRLAVLRALGDLGGRAPKATVLASVEEILRDRLGPHAYKSTPNSRGRMRWEVMTEFARYRLASEGLIKSGSPRGIWEISDAGRQLVGASVGRGC